ncbi:MAG TPA: purine-nucleoside phosphorylase [Planctomycetota bacterium]|nr:purine-nucleoside phosphorylase [Planctomycetota bacterium]
MSSAASIEARVEALAVAMAAKSLEKFELAIVLGSGLGAFAAALSNPRAIPYDELEGMPTSTVIGHAGRFVQGEVSGVRVLVQQGRAHLYEGWGPHDATRAVRAFAKLGCRGLIVTNAAGGLRREWQPGTLVCISDHLNMQGRSAVLVRERSSGAIYSEEFRAALERGAREAGVALESGVYCGLLGPTYETPAEIRMVAKAGADLVGMSTVAEASAACAAGMQVGGISLVTNHAAGISTTKLDHAEVLAAGEAAAGKITKLLLASIPHLAAVAKR